MTDGRRQLVCRRLVLALAVVAAAGASAFAAVVVDAGDSARGATSHGAVAPTLALGDEHGHVTLTPRVLHPQPLSRVRGFGLVALSAVVSTAALTRRTARVGRPSRTSTFSVPELPLGRAPPLARIA